MRDRRRLTWRLTLATLFAALAACGGGGGAPSTPVAAAPPITVVPTTEPSLFAPQTLALRPRNFPSAFFCPPFLSYGAPSIDGDFLCRTAFAIGHDADARTPAWVIERLTLGGSFGGVERTEDFKPDPDLLPGRRAELRDYVGSGFDRGHMAPAADMTFSNQAMSESFYLSNIAPQNPTLNRGAWARLEQQVRDWLLQRPELVVITGPMWGAQRTTIGTTPVRVPYAFFKVIYDPNRSEAVAFVYTNVAPDAADLAAHRVPLEQLEALTGLAFLSRRF